MSPNHSIYDCEPGNEAYNEWSQWMQGAASGYYEFDWLPSIGAGLDYIWAYPEGDAAFLQHKGKYGGRYRWVPDQIWDAQAGNFVDDKPKDKVFFRMSAYAGAGAWAGQGISTGKAKANVTIMGKEFSSQIYSENMWHGGSVVGAWGFVTKVVAKDTNGATEIEAPWVSVLAKAEVEGDREINSSPVMGQIDVGVMGGSELINRGVAISSSIDPSYRKSTTQPMVSPGQTPPLPIFGSSPSIWREPVPLGEPSHRGVYWSDTYQSFYGAGVFDAHEIGIVPPSTRTWSWMGAGTLTQQSNNDLNAAGPQVAVDAAFGATPESITGQSSTLKLSVTDAVGTETADHTINWHLPVENMVPRGTPIHSYMAAPAAIVFGNPASTNVPDETIQVVVNPSVWNFTLLSSDEIRAATGTVTFIGGAALTYFSAGVVPSVTALAFRATVGGASVGIQSGIAESRQDSCTNTLSEWQSAVADTQAAVADPAIGDVRVSPSSLAISNSDFRSQFQMTPWVVTRFSAPLSKGDGYNQNGYSGPAYGYGDVTDEVKVVGYYELGSSPTNE